MNTDASAVQAFCTRELANNQENLDAEDRAMPTPAALVMWTVVEVGSPLVPATGPCVSRPPTRAADGRHEDKKKGAQ